MKRLLVVWHTQFGATGQLAAASIEGARLSPGVIVEAHRAFDAGVEPMLAADGYLFAASENFGGLAGAVKDFFERVYYPCEGRLDGRPWTAIVCAGNDGAGAALGLERIATGLRLRKALPVYVYRSGVTAQRHVVPDDALARAREHGATLAAGIEAGLY
ncbi:MAG: flavodoxin family protein [Burkholderiales bacterium]